MTALKPYMERLCCANPKICEGEPGDDGLAYSYMEGGWFEVGPNFGCIHWEAMPEASGEVVVVART